MERPDVNTTKVSDELVKMLGGSWSKPVEVQFERLSDGTLQMNARTHSCGGGPDVPPAE